MISLLLKKIAKSSNKNLSHICETTMTTLVWVQDAVTPPLLKIQAQLLGYFKIFGEIKAGFHDFWRFWGIWINQMVKIFKILVFVALCSKHLEKNWI